MKVFLPAKTASALVSAMLTPTDATPKATTPDNVWGCSCRILRVERQPCLGGAFPLLSDRFCLDIRQDYKISILHYDKVSRCYLGKILTWKVTSGVYLQMMLIGSKSMVTCWKCTKRQLCCQQHCTIMMEEVSRRHPPHYAAFFYEVFALPCIVYLSFQNFFPLLLPPVPAKVCLDLLVRIPAQ